jgi:hypothetical protein
MLCDHVHQSDIVLKAHCGLQTTAFNAAMGFDGFVKHLSLSATAGGLSSHTKMTVRVIGGNFF